MLESRLVAGLDRLEIDLAAEVQERLLVFLAELQRWNRSINLTAIEDPGIALEKHLLDSLTILPFCADADRLLDFGSGAGLPGIPLQIARPQLGVWSVDAAHKKISFQKHIARTLQLKNFHPWHGRIEDFGRSVACPGPFPLVTARAVADLAVLVDLAAPLTARAGRLVAMKGPDAQRELDEAREALRRTYFEAEEARTFTLPFSGDKRTLLVLKKTS